MKPTLSLILLALLFGAPTAIAQAPSSSTESETSPSAQTSGESTEAGPEAHSPFFGGVPSGRRRPGTVPLPLADAIDRGFRYDLALVLCRADTRRARRAWMKRLADIPPNLTTP